MVSLLVISRTPVGSSLTLTVNPWHAVTFGPTVNQRARLHLTRSIMSLMSGLPMALCCLVKVICLLKLMQPGSLTLPERLIVDIGWILGLGRVSWSIGVVWVTNSRFPLTVLRPV